MVRRHANSRAVAKPDAPPVSLASLLSVGGGGGDAVGTTQKNKNNQAAVLSFNAPESQGLRALFAGFIDLYCETIPELRRGHLKNELRALLVELGVVPDFFFSDDLGPVRLVCSQLLSNLVRSVLMRTDAPEGGSRGLPFVGRAAEVINQSRFRTEFEEIDTIGRGAFGHVYRVRSKLDKHEYAVKKIVARDDAEQLSQRILHEVQILASLQHANVVRYHAGWIEVESAPSSSPETPTRPQRGMHTTRVRKDSPRINIEEIFDSDSDSELHGEGGEKGGVGNEISMASLSSVESSVAAAAAGKRGGGRFWGGAETSTEEDEEEEVKEKEEEERGDSSSLRDGESTAEDIHSPLLATAVPMVREEPRSEDESGEDWMKSERSEERDQRSVERRRRMEGGGRGGEVVLMQLRVRMAIFIQMELCTSTLERWLMKRNETMRREHHSSVDGPECISLFRQLMAAVEYIHGKGLIHRDIKPGNLFLKWSETGRKGGERGGRLQLLLGDFGLSCLDGEEAVSEEKASEIEETKEEGGGGRSGGDSVVLSSSAISVRHSMGVGTCAYAAPEQLRTNRYGREVDLFSSGIVLLELFSPVHTGSERVRVMERAREDRRLPEGMHERWKTVADLVLRMTSPQPSERPTAAAVMAELAEEGSEVRALREMVANQRAEIDALRAEVRRLKEERVGGKRERRRAK